MWVFFINIVYTNNKIEKFVYYINILFQLLSTKKPQNVILWFTIITN